MLVYFILHIGNPSCHKKGFFLSKLIIFISFYFREQQILSKWQQLIDMLERKKKVLVGFNELLGMFREIESMQNELRDMEVTLHFLFGKPKINFNR